jgi:sulfonate transport system substrate-binding protein
MKRVVLIVIAIMVVTFGMTGFEGNAMEKKVKNLPVLKVALMPFNTSLSAKYVSDKGWDKKNGFRIENITFSMGAPMNEALGANQWDIATIGAAAIFSVTSYDAKLIADIDFAGAGHDLYARPNDPMVKVKGYNPTYPNILGSPETVKGKTIICEVGTVYQMRALKWIEKLGLKANDVKITHMSYAQGWQAFKAGQGDVIALAYPQTYEAIQKGYIKVGSFKDLGVPYNDVLVVNKNSYTSKKAILVKFVKLLFRANDELEKNKKLKQQKLQEWYAENGQKIDAAAVEFEVNNKPFITTKQAKTWKFGESTKQFAEFMASIGKLPVDKLPMLDKNISNEILKKALK